MNKTVISVLVAFVVAGAGAYGAATYGDKKIAAFYDGSVLNDKRLKIEGKPDMGLMGGTAQWTATITPDLCSPDLHFKLRGEDKITRGLSGYNIESKIFFQPQHSNEEWFLLNANSQWAWSGNGNVKYTVPAAEHKLVREKSTLSWADITASVKFKNSEKDGLHASDWVLNAPELALKSQNDTQFLLQNMSFKAEGEMHSITGQSKGEAVLGKLLLQTKKHGQNVEFELLNLRQTSNQNTTEQSVDLQMQTSADSARYQDKTFSNLKFNTEIKGLNLAAMQKWMDFSKRQGQECVKRRDVEQEFEQLVLLLLKNGLTAESKGNEVHFNGNKATLDMSATVAAGEYANRQEVMQKLPEKLKYSLNATVDKPLLDSLGWFNQGGVPMSDADLDAMLAQVRTPFKAVREGQTIKLSVQQ